MDTEQIANKWMDLDSICYRIVRAAGRSFGANKDLIQDCFASVSTKLLSRIGQIEERTRERYLAKSARWEARRYFRRYQQEQLGQHIDTIGDAKDPLIPYTLERRINALQAALPKLGTQEYTLVRRWLESGGGIPQWNVGGRRGDTVGPTHIDSFCGPNKHLAT